ncbi:exocyst complex component 3-like protein 4 isoform X1 [Myxocyprinus asiaticus]|uniref:exocyst complex component 3-like protein 4 isoform X1 n=2 Tax=Myxocyprinus asiaticus TaxID=70543 RepID=UPI00222230DC|nr:exocyst complex component 3-like protein 4 isoform X1 [Myxocyprinus asiaticus]
MIALPIPRKWKGNSSELFVFRKLDHSHLFVIEEMLYYFQCFFFYFVPVLTQFTGWIRLMHGKMAESEKAETDGGNEVNDPPAWEKDALQTKCLKNGGRQLDSPVKEEMVGLMKSFRASLKLVSEKSPLTSKNKRSVRTSNDQKQPSNSPLQPPPSPSFSTGSPSQFSQQSSPLQNKKTLTRTVSDSAVAITGTLVKRGASIRQSLGLGSKKFKQEPLEPVTEAITSSEEQKPEDVDEVLQLRETYTLPEIPSMPLSVMEINKLIEMEVLEEAYVNLLSLRLELQRECQALEKEDCPVDLVHKEKDLRLLYGTLRNKMSNIVRNSSALPSRNKELLVYVAQIILEEEKRQGEPGGMPGWREAWRDAVRDGVRDTLKKVHLDSREQNTSWLAVHLGLLGKTIVEDLKRVKAELLNSYPADFKVFETYVSCHHEALGEHLKRLLEHVTEVKDYYALLEFIIHRYPSDKIMGSCSLQPEMKEDQRALPLDKDFLNQIKSKYCSHLQADMRTSFDRIIELENEEMWKERRKPETDEGLYSSHIDMDIWTNIKGLVQGSGRIDVNLEQKVVRACLEELKLFPKRFESAFVEWSNALSNSSLWAEYHISYMNSFSALKEHMACYKESCPIQFEQVQREIDGLTTRLSQTLMNHFKTDVKPFLRRQMTRKWFSFDEDFTNLVSRTKTLSEQSKYMSPTFKQTFVNEAHFFVVKEYVSQLMKNNYSCKNRKNETAASKITMQWEELKDLFQDMNSTLDWLHPVGNQLSKIVGCKKTDVKMYLQPMVENYPDIRKSHLSAVLYFRGIIRGREKHIILQRLTELKESFGNVGNKEYALFSEIQAAVNTDCLAGTPFSCLSLIVPDS